MIDFSATNSWRKFQSDRSRDKISTLQEFYKAGRTHGGQKLYIEELYKRKESGTKKVAISFVYVCLYFAGCLLAWSHFWRTLWHSQYDVGFCQKINPQKTFEMTGISWIKNHQLLFLKSIFYFKNLSVHSDFFFC